MPSVASAAGGVFVMRIIDDLDFCNFWYELKTHCRLKITWNLGVLEYHALQFSLQLFEAN